MQSLPRQSQDERGFSGAFLLGSVGPNIEITGMPTALPTCIRPESPVTRASHTLSIAAASFIVVSPARFWTFLPAMFPALPRQTTCQPLPAAIAASTEKFSSGQFLGVASWPGFPPPRAKATSLPVPALLFTCPASFASSPEKDIFILVLHFSLVK